MPEQSVVDSILSSVEIPPIPRVVTHLTQLLLKPDAGLREVGAAIAQDPGLAAQVLRIANSVYYGLEQSLLDIQRAAVVLGLRTLNEIVWRVAVMQTFAHLESQRLSLETLWRHSILTGQLAQWLVSQTPARLELGPSDLYTCGLLHDLGRLVLLSAHRDRYEEVLRLADENEVDSAAIETEHFGFSHPQAGAVLAFVWRLPEPLQDAIELHHGPERRLRGNATAALVALCDHVARCVERGPKATAETLSQHPATKLVGLSAQVLDDLVEQARVEHGQIEV
jgi:HD-like signal output (HDOD) protein